LTAILNLKPQQLRSALQLLTKPAKVNLQRRNTGIFIMNHSLKRIVVALIQPTIFT